MTSQFVAVTFLGGSDSDNALGLALDPATNVVIVGATLSDDFPASADAYDPAYNGSSDVFVARLRPSLAVTPDAPNGLSASDGTSSDYVSLSWNASTDADGYRLWRRAAGGMRWNLLANTSATNLDDATVGPGLSYEYVIYAQVRSNWSDSSAADTGWRATAAPADYDGDLKADPAVFNQGTGEWQALLSSANYVLVTAVLE